MEETRLLALAGLLHDVGKISYRAGAGKGNHSERGAALLEKYVGADRAYRELSDCVAYHHGTALRQFRGVDNHPAYIVYEADNISAGIDRRAEEGSDGGFDMTAPLQSVFMRLNGRSEEKVHYLRGLGNKDGKINYPAQAGAVIASTDKYRELLAVLEDNLLRTDFAQCTVNEMLKIIEAVAAYIPSSTNKAEACDISLYDHSRLTAAIAVAMKQYFTAIGITDYKAYCSGSKNAEFREMEAFLLIEADMSGIQDFIYTIPSKGALKSLRGRSFYLEMLIEHIADELLEQAGLSRANLLYTGGGHFRILAANTDTMKAVLQSAQDKINDWMLKKFGTALYLQMAWQEISADELRGEGSGMRNALRALADKLSEGKMRRYSEKQLGELFKADSKINKTADGARECTVCRISNTSLLESEYDLGTICPQCQALYELGQNILGTGKKVLAVSTDAKKGIAMPSLTDDSLYLCALSENEAQNKAGLKRVYTKNDMSTGSLLATHLWVGDYAKYDGNGSVKDFEALAKSAGGIERLAVMRADVDNLGATFIAGFDKEFATLSRYAALSRQLSLFFKYHINDLCNRKTDGDGDEANRTFEIWRAEPSKTGREMAIVYSGGDDMFVVGAWDDVLGLSVDLYEAFKRYSCGKLTLSAGIAFFEHSYPIAQMARITELLEKKAKNTPHKNSVALFGINKSIGGAKEGIDHVHSWQDFKNGVLEEKLALLLNTLDFSNESKMARVNSKGKLPVGIGMLYKLMQMLEPIDAKDTGNLVPLVYMLARLEPSSGAAETTKLHYREFREKVHRWYQNEQDRSELATAVRLLVYGLREKRSDEKWI